MMNVICRKLISLVLTYCISAPIMAAAIWFYLLEMKTVDREKLKSLT